MAGSPQVLTACPRHTLHSLQAGKPKGADGKELREKLVPPSRRTGERVVLQQKTLFGNTYPILAKCQQKNYNTSPTEVSAGLKGKLISHFPFLPRRTRKHLPSGLGNVGRAKQVSPLLAPAGKCRRCPSSPTRVASVGRQASILTQSQRAGKGGGRLGMVPPCCPQYSPGSARPG